MTTGDNRELNDAGNDLDDTSNDLDDAGNHLDETHKRLDEAQLFASDPTIPADVLDKLGDRYSDFHLLGSGATSTVFQAHDNTLDKPVAIKILKHNSQADLIRFQREARIASKLGHPNLVNVLNFDVTDENNAFIVMDVVQGDDLKTVIEKRKQIPLERALPVAYYIAKGMAHAHSKNLAHRDLKSSNVMVQDIDSPNVLVIVVDFGLAKEQDQSKTGTASVIGSPLYMSPEQAQGQPADERADIYSLACIIYEMISGSTPFQEDDLFKLLQKHAYEPAPKLSSLVPNMTLPVGLDELLLKMMEKDRERRVQTMESVKQSILAIEQGKTGTIKSAAPAKVPIKLIAGAIILAGIVLSACLFQLDTKRKAKIRSKLTVSEKQRVLKAARQEADMANVHDYFEEDDGELGDLLDGKYVRCSNFDAVTDDTLRFLPTVKWKLTQISFEGTHITGEGLRFLRGAGVSSLCMSRVKLSENGWRQLNALESLRVLSFVDSDISDDDLKNLANNKHIVKLNLSRCPRITDTCAQTLKTMKQLKRVHVAKTKITDAFVDTLARKGSFDDLDFEETRVTDEGVKVLCQYNKDLDKLSVGKCNGITRKSVEYVAANEPNIRRLNLGMDDKVDPASIRLLSACPHINDLSIQQIPIGAIELEVITKFRLSRLYLADVTFDDSALHMFQNQTRLEKLVITGPKISDKSRNTLKDMLPPKCIIYPMRGSSNVEGFSGIYEGDPKYGSQPQLK